MHRADVGGGGAFVTERVFQADLHRLVGEFCHGTLSEADAATLDATLAGDLDARQFYNNYMFLHAELYTQHASIGCETLAARIEEHEAELVHAALFPPRRPRFSRMALAATILAVAIGSS